MEGAATDVEGWEDGSSCRWVIEIDIEAWEGASVAVPL